MKKSILAYTTMAAVLSVLALGCATGGGMTDDEAIAALLKNWEAGVLEIDIDKMMATYSENFEHDGYEYDAASKDELREYIEFSIDEGNFDGVELYLDDIDVEIDGTEASVYPIDYTNDQGTITIELILTKEKGGWLITDMLIEGM